MHIKKTYVLLFFFYKYKLMKIQQIKRKLRLYFCNFSRFYSETENKTTICNSNAKVYNVFFSFFKLLKDYYAPKCTKLEYA